MNAAAKLAGVGPDRIDQVIDGLSDAEVIDIYDRWIDQIAHFVIDEFADPIGLAADVDSMAVVCRIYHRYMEVQL